MIFFPFATIIDGSPTGAPKPVREKLKSQPSLACLNHARCAAVRQLLLAAVMLVLPKTRTGVRAPPLWGNE